MPPATPRDEGGAPGKRLRYIDNLRLMIIVFVVMHHLAVTISGFGGWYYYATTPLDTPSTVWFAFYLSFQQAYFLGLLFLIAGYFEAGSYDRKGFGPFVKARFIRLIIPAIIYMVVITPFIEYVELGNPYTGFSLAGFLSGTGVMWFVVALFFFSLVYALVRLAARSASPPAVPPPSPTSDPANIPTPTPASDPTPTKQSDPGSFPAPALASDTRSVPPSAMAPALVSAPFSVPAPILALTTSPAPDFLPAYTPVPTLTPAPGSGPISAPPSAPASAPDPAPGKIRIEPSFRNAVLLILAIAISAFLIRIVQPIGTNVLNMQICYFASYIALFIVGILAYRNNLFGWVSHRTGKRWLIGGIVLGFFAWFALIVVATITDSTAALNGGLTWQSAAYSLWESFVAVAMSIGLIVVFRDALDRQTPLVNKMTRNSYAVYMFHPPIIVGVALVLASVVLYPIANWLMLCIICVPLCFAITHFVILRVPVLKDLL